MLAAAIQMNSRDDKEQNIKSAERLIDAAAEKGVKLAVLPEMFNFLGRGEDKLREAEDIPGPTIDRIAAKAARHKMYIIAGSILEKCPAPDKVYNTSVLLNPDGEIAARYSKIHLFDVEVEGQPAYRESATVAPGEEIVTAGVGDVVVGLNVCYDLRFPELFRSEAEKGAQVLSLPAAFTLHTGMDHWEVLVRARAIENTCYVIAAGQTGKHPVNRECFGNSMIVDPWGFVAARAPHGEAVVCAEIDMEYLEKVRQSLPSLKNRRLKAY